MFALIITIISIALVAALALATIYYGGTAFNRNSTEIKAAEIMLQQQQIRAALTLYKVDHEGNAPQNLQTLISSNYLRQVPTYVLNTPDPSLIPTAHAAEATPWIMPAEYNATFILAENVSAPVCAEVNFKARSFRGVPNQLYTSLLPLQCYYSSDKQSNIVVVSDDITSVTDVLTGTNITPTNPSQPFTVPLAELNTSDPSIDPNTASKWQNPPSEFTGTSSNTTPAPANEGDLAARCLSGSDDCIDQGSISDPFTRDYTILAKSSFSAPLSTTTVQLTWSDLYYHTPSISCPTSPYYTCTINLVAKTITLSNWDTLSAPNAPFSITYNPNGQTQDSFFESQYGISNITTSATDLNDKNNKKVFLPLDVVF